MKLCADIIFENIKAWTLAQMSGYRKNKLTLSRPEFYTGETEDFLADHVYIVHGEGIPRRANVEKGAVLICLGEIPQMSYFQERCCFIKIKADTDPFDLSNRLSQVYNKYDQWQEQLTKILETTGDIEEMVNSAVPIFGNPILVMDANFKIMASAGYEGLESTAEAFEQLGADALSMSALEQYLQEREVLFDVREPMRLNIMDSNNLSMNLFDADEYAGSITINYMRSFYQNSHIPLIKFFADYLLIAMKKNSGRLLSQRSVLRKVFMDLLSDTPVDSASRRYLENVKRQKNFVCVVLHLSGRFAQIPVEYICKKMVSIFAGSIPFEYKSRIVAFVETADLHAEENFRDALGQRIEVLTGAMDIKAGISGEFSNPYSCKLYYEQALAALENGLLVNGEERYYHFEDYALMELISACQKNLPIEMYYTQGLRRIFAHDEMASVSYVETLRAYLNNNMNVTATAAELYVHRSTLLERLSRIERELGENLKDPDVRLQIQIILKALSLREQIAGNRKE